MGRSIGKEETHVRNPCRWQVRWFDLAGIVASALDSSVAHGQEQHIAELRDTFHLLDISRTGLLSNQVWHQGAHLFGLLVAMLTIVHTRYHAVPKEVDSEQLLQS